jgi:ribulose-phosphate 3-epimerase
VAVICPTITAENPAAYREQVARVEPFVERLHIDLADGVFAPTTLLGTSQIYWPEQVSADLHVMYEQPQREFETLVSLHPNLVIVHAEAKGDLLGMLLELQSYGVKAGLALLTDSSPEQYAKLLGVVDHVLLFAGRLGYQGSDAHMEVLKKVPLVKAINPTAELAWDGGITVENLPLLVEQGIEVLNVGSFIHEADEPDKAYQQLQALLK